MGLNSVLKNRESFSENFVLIPERMGDR
jgi:hypothetical protein